MRHIHICCAVTVENYCRIRKGTLHGVSGNIYIPRVNKTSVTGDSAVTEEGIIFRAVHTTPLFTATVVRKDLGHSGKPTCCKPRF
jgi:hypothetical protein